MRFMVLFGGMLVVVGTSVPFANVVMQRGTTPVMSQGTITGAVTVSSTGTPLAGASVTVAGTRTGALTDLDGRYVIAGVAIGSQRIRATMAGYVAGDSTVLVEEDKQIVLDFQLDTASVKRSLNRRR